MGGRGNAGLSIGLPERFLAFLKGISNNETLAWFQVGLTDVGWQRESAQGPREPALEPVARLAEQGGDWR